MSFRVPSSFQDAGAMLAELGIARLELPIPFREAGGTVNVYAIEEEGGGIALFDTGTGGEESCRLLEEKLAAVGRRVEDVRRVFVSHGHVDHYGAAQFVVSRSGASVLVHREDAAKVTCGPGRKDFLRYGTFLGKAGVPAEVLERLGEMYRGHRKLGEPLEKVTLLEGGETVRFGRFSATVVPMPGHTPGLVCLHVPERRLLFSSDHLLAQISPNPLLELPEGGGRFRALLAYLDSVRRTREMELDLVLPGHGEMFSGHREKIDGLLAFLKRRQARLVEALADGPKTPYGLVPRLFPAAERNDLFLMISEIVGNLDVLERDGVVEALPGVPFRYRLVPGRGEGRAAE